LKAANCLSLKLFEEIESNLLRLKAYTFEIFWDARSWASMADPSPPVEPVSRIVSVVGGGEAEDNGVTVREGKSAPYFWIRVSISASESYGDFGVDRFAILCTNSDSCVIVGKA
jgi:hypothetical protein